MVKKTLAVALGAMLMAGSAAAVEVNQGGKGDLLIAPLFMVKNGWQSELKVINTSVTDSAVAKVVFHAPGRSDEVLDFLIFLSPGDVWTGSVVENADGTVGVTSADASSITVANAGGCPAASGTSGFRPTEAKFTLPVSAGYVNIFESRMLRVADFATLVPNADGTVSKEAILRAYSAACLANAAIETDDTDNVLTGSVTLSNPLNGNKLTLGMTALADYDNLAYLTVGGLTTFATNAANTSKQQVEDALWASNFAVPYNVTAGNLSFATVTFPTKETFNLSAGSQYTPFFPAVNDKVNDVGTAVPVGYDIRDEEEHKVGTVGCAFSPCTPDKTVSLPREVNIIQFIAGSGESNAGLVYTSGFTKGWANVAIAADVSDTRSTANYNNFGQSGAPALTTYIQWDMTGGSLQGTWQYAAKTYAPAAN